VFFVADDRRRYGAVRDRRFERILSLEIFDVSRLVVTAALGDEFSNWSNSLAAGEIEMGDFDEDFGRISSGWKYLNRLTAWSVRSSTTCESEIQFIKIV
jgi:hypothetical protein